MDLRVGFGGGCHWCTEAVFQRLAGVQDVRQGWASSSDEPARFSEAVVVHFDPEEISLAYLVRVHLHTHSCTSAHALRGRYRSAVYTNKGEQDGVARAAIAANQIDFEEAIITEVVPLGSFRENVERYRDYYRSDPERPFCRRFIAPKLEVVRRLGPA